MILRHSLRLILSQTRFHWWLRAALKRLTFLVRAKVFGVRYSLREEKTNLRSLQQIVSDVLMPLIVAGGFAGLLQFIDPYFHPYYQKISISIPEDGDYVTFLATVSGIGGVFIGLYYAGISVVGGAMYARVPNNIRDLLAYERIGNIYMRILSFLTALGLILIAFRISGLPRIYLAVPFVTVLAGIGVFAFVKLGQRAFFLFDPTRLSYYIFEQLQYWIGTVKVSGFQWLDRSFQNHAHRRASTTIDTLETLAEITAKEPHLSGKPFVHLSQHLLQFMVNYEQSKANIPTDSAWFGQQYQHPDWYSTEDSQVRLAHSTGTFLQPDVTRNKEWVENKVLPILQRCISVNLKDQKFSDLFDLFEYMDSYTKNLAQVGEVRRAFEFLKNSFLDILKQITKCSDDETANDRVLEEVAAVEILASFAISIALGYHEHSKSSNRQHIEKCIASIQWNNNSSIYRQDFPSYCLERLEWFAPKLDFEKQVDGKIISPNWYCSELVCQIVAERFVENTQELVFTASTFFNKAISEELLRDHPWLAAAILSREWEYWHKVENQMNIWEEIWRNLVARQKIEGLDWPKFEIEKLSASFEKRKTQILKLMSQHNLLLALSPRPQGFPDYAGQFLHTSGEVAFDALISNKVELFRSVFEHYMYGCLLRFDSLFPKTTAVKWRERQEIKIASATLLDVMTVSGYAKLLADYYGNNVLWNEVSTVWEKYFEKKDKSSLVSLFANAVVITDTSVEIPHRGVLRTTWKQKIYEELQNVPRNEDFSRGLMSSEIVIDHSSPLVRIFAQEYDGRSFDGIDVFITYYLQRINEANRCDFGPRRRILQESIKFEEQRILSDHEEVDSE